MDDKKERQLLRYRYFFQVFDEWFILKENGRDIGDILCDAGFRKIAIYGMGRMCVHVHNALKNSEIEITCIIDKQSRDLYGGLHICDLECVFEAVDAVIYTDMDIENEILLQLKEKLSDKVVSLADVIFDNIPQ